MQPIKIALGDLNHRSAGRHSFFMPLNVSYIASYTLAQLGPETVDIRIYDDPDLILKDIASWKPHVVGVSNYLWKAELNSVVYRYAKKMNPDVICVSGGPNFPYDHEECREYLAKRPEIDLYCYLESEISFSQLIKKLLEGMDLHQLKRKPQAGVMSIHPDTGELVAGEPAPRLMNLDDIPSPYLTGMLEPWFNGHYAPMIETSRGCPFSCTFCVQGDSYFTKVAKESIPRVETEITYIAERMRKWPNVLLAICDSNFGMLPRDEEVAAVIRRMQDEYGWPNAFDVTSGKKNHDRILKVASLLGNKMLISCSLQSVNPKTLEVIKRKNLTMEQYRLIRNETKKHGMRSTVELIYPMPEETKETFFKGIATVMDVINPERISPFTTMFLPGTEMASKACRTKYQMVSKFRILPRQFGEYVGDKCFEIEEVCIETNTLPFEDYLEIRGFGLISVLFSSEQFNIVHKHLKELNIKLHDFTFYLWELIKSGKTALSEIYTEYVEEAKGELFDSPEAIYEYFSKQENYDKLKEGKLGDNLIRKFTTKYYLEAAVPSIELAYSSVEEMAKGVLSEEIRESLASAKRWTIATQNVSAIFKDSSYIHTSETLQLPYDVNAWHLDGPDSNPLMAYRRPVTYRIFSDVNKLEKIFAENKELCGGDLFFQISKLLVNWDMRNFFRNCESLNKETPVTVSSP